MPQDKFQSENPYILTAQHQTADNNQTALNASLAETQGPIATSIIFQPTGLTGTTGGNPGGTALSTASQTVGNALGGAGTTGFTPSCPESTQFVRVMRGDTYSAVRAHEVTLDDYLWNPISRQFERVNKADTVDDIDLIHVLTANGIEAIGSIWHPLIRDATDTKGLKLSECKEGFNALTENGQLEQSRIASIRQYGKGSVVHLETKGRGHIYVAGSNPDRMVAWHNLKPLDGIE